MPISYSKLLKIFEDRGINTYIIKRDKIIGQASWKKIHEGGHIDTRTIERLCEYLHCQPGDILEHLPDAEKDSQ